MSRLSTTVSLEIGGEEYVLEPTLKAYERLDREFEGITNCFRQCSMLSINAAAHAIIAGADMPPREIKSVKKVLFENGMSEIADDLAQFFEMMINPKGEEVTEGE